MYIHMNVYMHAPYTHTCVLKHTLLEGYRGSWLPVEGGQTRRGWATSFSWPSFLYPLYSKIKEHSIKYNRILWSHEKKEGRFLCADVKRSLRHTKWTKTKNTRNKTVHRVWSPLWKLWKGYAHIHIQHTNRCNFFLGSIKKEK